MPGKLSLPVGVLLDGISLLDVSHLYSAAVAFVEHMFDCSSSVVTIMSPSKPSRSVPGHIYVPEYCWRIASVSMRPLLRI